MWERVKIVFRVCKQWTKWRRRATTPKNNAIKIFQYQAILMYRWDVWLKRVYKLACKHVWVRAWVYVYVSECYCLKYFLIINIVKRFCSLISNHILIKMEFFYSPTTTTTTIKHASSICLSHPYTRIINTIKYSKSNNKTNNNSKTSI